MTIKIVMGIPCAGKSTFIKKHFPNSTKIDLYDFQKQYEFLNLFNTIQSYEDTRQALIKAIKNKEDVVLEHTLLKAIRREVYVKSIKDITDEPIDIYLIHPPLQRFKKNHIIRFGDEFNDEDLIQYYELLELPTKEEGFANVYVVNDIDKWRDV